MSSVPEEAQKDGDAQLPPTYIPTPPSPLRLDSPRQTVGRSTYTAKVLRDLWTIFKLIPRTEQGKKPDKRESGFKGAVELQDYKPNGFLNHLMCCVEIFYHFDGTTWKNAYLTEDQDAVLRMLDRPVRNHLKEMEDTTSEVSADIRESFENWSAYVLSWLDENRVLLDRLHAEFEESMKTKHKQRAEKWARRRGHGACLPQLLDELKAYA